jgi:uncharacterized protein
MGREVARNAIEFFADFLGGSGRHLTIAFGTGEPLLSFDLIAYSVRHARQRFGDRVYFTFTTNGLLLREDILRFAEDHDFGMAISMDGPQRFHDAHRRDQGGKGTFKQVLETWEYVSRRFPAVASKSKVSFTIYGQRSWDELEETADWFNQRFPHEQLIGSFAEGQTAMQLYDDLAVTLFKKITLERPRAFEMSLLGEPLRRIHRTMTDFDPEHSGTMGCCFPGKRTLVGSGGELYLCDRCADAPQIGHIDRGYDDAQLAKIVETFRERIECIGCCQCWAYRLCSLCYMTVPSQPVGLSPSIVGAPCLHERALLTAALRLYVSLWVYWSTDNEDPWAALGRILFPVSEDID